VSTKDSRRHPRISLNRPGRIRIADGPEYPTQLIDISEGGATSFYSSPVAVGTGVELHFHLNTGKRMSCHVYGEVRHHSTRGESHILGIQFTHFAPDAAEAVREFVRQKSQIVG
jgi:hypothetical protein